MDHDTGRDEDGLGDDEYWRRRAAVLVGVFAAIALMGWACSAGEDDPEGARTSGSPPPTAMPTVTVTKTARPVVEGGGVDGGGMARGGVCATGSVVVTMRASGDVYGPGERPEFRVTAVNTGSRACAFDIGRRGFDLRITSGDDLVWSSAACARGDGASVRRTLRRGVPYVDTVTWDRRRGTGDCEGERAPVRPGTYVAALKPGTGSGSGTGSGTVQGPKRVFRLR